MSALEDLQTENARLAARVAALEAALAAPPSPGFPIAKPDEAADDPA